MSRQQLSPAASMPQSGSTNDFVLELMDQHGIERTAENYLELAYMGEVPAEIDPETRIAMQQAGLAA